MTKLEEKFDLFKPIVFSKNKERTVNYFINIKKEKNMRTYLTKKQAKEIYWLLTNMKTATFIVDTLKQKEKLIEALTELGLPNADKRVKVKEKNND